MSQSIRLCEVSPIASEPLAPTANVAHRGLDQVWGEVFFGGLLQKGGKVEKAGRAFCPTESFCVIVMKPWLTFLSSCNDF